VHLDRGIQVELELEDMLVEPVELVGRLAER
jgi:hypothetical protein